MGFGSQKLISRAAIVAGAILFFAVIGLRAQETTGRILGTVLDAQGSAVPGAQIAITNQDTGVVRNVTSSADGLYNVPQVAAGKYTVAVSATGFARSEVRDVEVVVATDTRINLKLQVGSLQQTVTVSEAVPLVDTTSSSLGGTVTEQSVSELPLNGRNWAALTLLQPGVSQSLVYNNILSFPGLNGTVFSSNGASIRSNMVSLDGANTLSVFDLNAASMNSTTLGVDGIKEYKVVTSMFDAEYGLRTGSQTTIVSKGGTNQFHGDAFEYLRNSSLDARNYFDALDTSNANGFGTDKSRPYPGKRIPPFRRNNFGGSFGGPIQKDKTFFFGVFEGIRAQTGITISTVTLPAGCFVNGAVPAVIANNGCVAGSAASPITVNPIILPLARLFPAPNVVGYPTFNYTFPYLQPSKEVYGQGRIDHTFSAADSLFVRYTQDDADSVLNSPYQQYTTPTHSVSNFATVAENHVFSPTLLNTARLSYSRTWGFDGITCTAVGGICGSVPGPGFPTFSPFLPTEGFGTLSPGSGVTALAEGTPIKDIQDIITVSDDVFWTKGKHAFKFGVLINNYLKSLDFVFGSQEFFPTLANFFVGDYNNLQITLPNSAFAVNFRFETYGFYAQDDYRMTSRLTWNLGVRYEFNTTPREMDPAIASSVRSPLDATGTPGPPILNTSLHNFGPRVGFAWDVTGKGKTAVRGGAGLYYDVATWGEELLNYGISNPPAAVNFQITNTLPTPLIPLAVPLTLAPNVPQSPRVFEYDFQQPTVAQYNLSVAQQLPWGMGLNVGYIGSRGWHLIQMRDANPAVPLARTANGLPITCFANAAGACPGAAEPPLLSPFWGSYNQVQARGDSYFNSLQINLNKKLGQGLQFGFAYTWSRSIDDGQGMFIGEGAGEEQNQLPDGYSERFDRGPSGWNVTNNVRFNMTYHAPNFIKSEGVAGKFLNGWWLSSIVSAQSGYPVTPILGADRALEGFGNNVPIYDRPNLDASFNSNTVKVGTVREWFNPTMFDLQPAGTFGNEGRGLFDGPGLENVDFSLVKDTKVGFLGEAGLIEFRTEVFNLLNHANFYLPSTTIWSSGNPAGVPAGQIGTAAIPALGTAGQITSTVGNSRQIQFAIKLLF